MLPQSIRNLIAYFSKLPSVGPRQAARFVFHLLKHPEKEIKGFGGAIFQIAKKITKCSLCFRFIEVPEDKKEKHFICSICKDPQRDKSTICVVEKDTDIEAIENTDRYKGLYHVLGESKIKEFDKEKIKQLHLEELKKRIKNTKEIKEIIIATSATTDGDTLALYVSKYLKPLGVKITRLGRGLSTGSELEYMDEETLSQAFLGRR